MTDWTFDLTAELAIGAIPFGDRTLLSGGAISDNGDGSATVATCTAWCKISDSDTAVGSFFTFVGDTSVSLTDMTTNYIYLDYNEGTPQIVVATSITTHGFKQDHILVGTIFRNDTTLHFHQASHIGIGGVNRADMHHREEAAAHRASGLVTSDGGSLALSITTGVIYEGLSRHPTTVDGSTWSTWWTANSGSTWAEVTGQSTINNTQYNDITSGLVTLTAANRYAVHWVYVDIDGTHLHLVYGQGDYKANEAEEASVPSVLPNQVVNYGVLIAKVIVKKSTTTLIIGYPWTTVFMSTLATDHGSLGGLSDVADHAYALLHNGTRALSGAWDMGSQNLTNVNIDSGDISGTTWQTHTLTLTGNFIRSGAHSLTLTTTATTSLTLPTSGTLATQTYANGVDHGGLAGLGDDDHTQYQKETDFTAGSVLFRGSSVITEDTSNLFWDDTNKVLGIGTNSPAPSAKLHIGGDIFLINSGGDPRIVLGDSTAAGNWGGIRWNSSSDYIGIGTSGANIDAIVIKENGNVGIGVTDPDTKLEIFNAGDQLKLSFDGTDNTVFAVDTNGVLTITPSGAAVDFASKNLTGLGTLSAFTAGGAINFATQALTNLDINSGTIDGADVTVGSGKTLNVSAGTLTLANDQISGDKINGGTIGSTTITTLSCGTLNGVGTIDSTTEGTIETAIDTLANLTSVQGHTLTLTGDFIRSGAHSLTLITTGTTSITLPTSGTLVNSTHTHALAAGATDVTATYGELNILDDATLTTAELNLLDLSAQSVIAGELLVGTGSGTAAWQKTGVKLSAPDISGSVTAASTLTMPAFTAGGAINMANNNFSNVNTFTATAGTQLIISAVGSETGYAFRLYTLNGSQSPTERLRISGDAATAVMTLLNTSLTLGGNIVMGGNAITGHAQAISDNAILTVDHVTPVATDYARFTANGLEGRDVTEVKTDLSLNNVENTAHSTDAHTMTIDGVDVSAHAGNTTTAHGAVSAATASKFVVRDASARAKFAAPGAAGDVLIKGTRHLIAEMPTLTTDKTWKGVGGVPAEADWPAAGATVATGTWTGDGNNNRQITVGFKCSLVIVHCNNFILLLGLALDENYSFRVLSGVILHNAIDLLLHATDGFVVDDPQYNFLNRVYDYWAISE